MNFYPFKSKYSTNSKNVVGTIVNYKIDGNKMTINIKAKEKLVINYYFKNEEEKIYYLKKIELGDKIRVNGNFNEPSNKRVFNLFDYKDYLYKNKIYYIIEANKIVKLSNNTSIFYYIKNKIVKRINNIDKTGYLKTFILGDKNDLDSNVMERYEINGISHLFSISGMHVSLLVNIIFFILNKVSYNIKYKYTIVNFILLFYLFLTNVSVSILRATIMTILSSVNKCFNLKISKLDIMFITLIIAIIINPFIIFLVGFQFSYMISLSLVLFGKKINKIKNGLLRNLYLSFVCFIISFPICIYYYYQVNVLSLIFNLIVIPIVSIVIFPLSLIVFVFPFIYDLFLFLVTILEKINFIFSNIKFGLIIFCKPSIVIVFLYYTFIFLSFHNKNIFIIVVLMVILHKTLPYYDEKIKLVVFDVGQGDSMLIKMSNNNGNILVDTGGILKYEKEEWEVSNNEYTLVNNLMIPYLKSIGIAKINYLILTHGDYDHMGEAINLVNNFKVEKVIFNCGEFNELEQELIKVLDKKKIPYYSCIKELNIDDNKLYFLNNKDYGNENDNSSVIYTELNNYKFLFMGDAGVDVEQDLIEKYNLQDIDVLKVGHHGSKTSSSKSFIDKINPKYSIISVGKNNRYGHPNDSVLDNLYDSKIYRTDQDGSIMFKVKNNKLKIETCPP